MRYSYKWLQEHIAQPLPAAEEVASIITERAFEVEETEKRGEDTIFEIKVLPDRAHDALSHRGMAREIAALCGLSLKDPRPALGDFKGRALDSDAAVSHVRVTVEDPRLCSRYIGTLVEGVTVAPSPAWLKEKLESIGQRSINNIVDITNYVLFDIGQPMHAFDADKVAGGITVRLAQKGETMTTLDNKSITLDGTELVIADNVAVLALAGVKGGKKAEVTDKTTRIIFESANFQPTLTRRTSAKHNIKTDASKRFENGITSLFAKEGMDMATLLIGQITPKAKFGPATDVCVDLPRHPYRIGLSSREVSQLLGATISDEIIERILAQIGLDFTKVSDPRTTFIETAKSLIGTPFRRDIRILYDLPDATNCSVLTLWSAILSGWSAFPRIVVDQFAFTVPISEKEAIPGDLVFSDSGSNVGNTGAYYSRILDDMVPDAPSRRKTVEYMPGTDIGCTVDHVGVYVGDGNVIHSSVKLGGAVLEKLATSVSFKEPYSFRRLIVNNEPRYVVNIPPERLDLRIPEDLIEEIGRHYGYGNVIGTTPMLKRSGAAEKEIFYGTQIRNLLVARGFSEVFTYSFARPGDGDVEVMNPVGKDRPFMRRDLATGVHRSLMANYFNAPLLGCEDIRIFELGHVFHTDGEKLRLALGVRGSGKKKVAKLKEELRETAEGIVELLGAIKITNLVPAELSGDADAGLVELDIDTLLSPLPEPTGVPAFPPLCDVSYRSFSTYPFIVRDIALFVPEATNDAVPAELIRKEAGNLVVRFSLFDRFQKPGDTRVSYAYRLVFQSDERTLTDDEVHTIMEKVTKACVAEGWEVR